MSLLFGLHSHAEVKIKLNQTQIYKEEEGNNNNAFGYDGNEMVGWEMCMQERGKTCETFWLNINTFSTSALVALRS